MAMNIIIENNKPQAQIKKTALVCLFAGSIFMAQAQEKVLPTDNTQETVATTDANELSFYVTGGMSNLVYTLPNGTVSGGFGAGIGVEYTFNINKTLGFATGLELATLGAEAAFSNISETYQGIDDVGSDVLFTYSSEPYSEMQSVMMLNLPLKLQLKMAVAKKTHFFIAGGVKFGLPLKTTAKIDQTVTSAGYYEYENQTYHDMTHHGFLQNTDIKGSEASPVLGMAAVASLETGLRLTLSEKIGLYVGAYFDCGLNNLKKTDDKHLVNYNTKVTYESVLNTSLADRTNLMSAGVKIRLSIHK
jgi:hypothetical protein